MKTLFFGIILIILIGAGGLVYRNAVEHPNQQVACPMDAKICPDGTAVGRTGLSCTFVDCPLPNVSVNEFGIAYAVPEGFVENDMSDATNEKAYSLVASSTERTEIVIRHYTVADNSTPLGTIKDTAIGNISEMPLPATAFSSSVIGTHRFTVVNLERFEGVVSTAYYLAREKDVLRFDAVDYSPEWTNSGLDISSLPAHKALINLLTGLQGI